MDLTYSPFKIAPEDKLRVYRFRCYSIAILCDQPGLFLISRLHLPIYFKQWVPEKSHIFHFAIGRSRDCSSWNKKKQKHTVGSSAPILQKLETGISIFTWGIAFLVDQNGIRTRYITAISNRQWTKNDNKSKMCLLFLFYLANQRVKGFYVQKPWPPPPLPETLEISKIFTFFSGNKPYA